MGKNKTVRDFVSGEDSTYVLDALEVFFNNPEIHRLYSQDVAGLPVHEYPGMYKREGLVGKFARNLQDRQVGEFEGSSIRVDTDYVPSWVQVPGTKGRLHRTSENTIIHEAMGHGLLEALYGYQEKPSPIREEYFPYMVQAYSNRGRYSGWNEEDIELNELALKSLNAEVLKRFKDIPEQRK